MTTEQRKEELRKKFEEYFWFDGILSTRETRRLVPFNRDNVFDFFYSEIEAREKQIQEIKKGFEERIKELEPKKSDYWNGARNAYVSSLNFINRKTDDKLDSMHGHTEIVG